jgi:hypothetical protein
MTETSTPKEEIRQALDRGEPKPWIWSEDGDEVIGQAVGVEKRQTRHGEPYFLILVVDGEERSVLAGNQVLLGKLKGLHLQPGDWVGIRRLEERESQNGKTYRDYSVKTLQAEARELSFERAKALPETVTGEVVDDGYTDFDAPPEDLGEPL